MGSQQYAADWQIVMRICRSYAYARATRQYAVKYPIPESPLGQTLYSVTADWKAVHQDTERSSILLYENVRRTAENSMWHGANMLRYMVAETNEYKKHFADLQREAMRQSTARLAARQNHLDWELSALKLVRDASATSLVFCGGFVTGAAWALGVGAAIKGSATWEDSGSFQKGVATASTELLFGVIPIMNAPGASEVRQAVTGLVLAFARTPAEMTVSYASGESVLGGVVDGTLKFQDYAFEEVIKKTVRAESSDKLKVCAIAVVTAIEMAHGALADLAKKSVSPRESARRGSPVANVAQRPTTPAARPSVRPVTRVSPLQSLRSEFQDGH